MDWLLLICEASLIDYLVEIEKLLINGSFKEALSRIQKILDGIEFSKKEILKIEILKIEILKCEVLLGLGLFAEGLELNSELLKRPLLKEYPLLEIDILTIKSSFLFAYGKIDEIFKQLYLGEQILDTILNKNSDDAILRSGNLQLLKGKVFLVKGNNEDAITTFQKALLEFEKIDNRKKVAETLTSLGKNYHYVNEFDLSVTSLNKALEIQNKIQDIFGKAITLNEFGTIFFYKGNKEKAQEYYQKSYDIFLKIGNKDFISRLLNNFGLIHNHNGKLREAEVFYQKALECQDQIGNKEMIARTTNNIGLLNLRMGNLAKAEEYFGKSLATFQEVGNIQNIMNSFNQLGRIFRLKGLFEDALLNFQLSLNMMEKITDADFNSKTLLYYISTAIMKNDLEQAEEKLAVLKQINLVSDNPLINIRTKLATALLLMKSDRVRNKAKAEDYFEEIIANELSEPDYIIDAMLNLCELKINELRETNNMELLEEAKSLANKIHDIAQKQHSMIIFAESYWLLSQIALIELDIGSAREYLTKAQNIAEEWGIDQLALKILKDQDKLLEKLELWENLSTKNASLPEIIETADIEEFFMKLYRDKGLDIQFPPEEPVMFMLLKSTGMPIFSKNFILDEELDDSLISGFLSAINIFANEAFSSTGPIKRIKHNDFTIITNNIETYLICYIFKGQSFSALQKLSKIYDKIKLNAQLWSELKLIYDRTITLSQKNELVLSSIVSNVMISSI